MKTIEVDTIEIILLLKLLSKIVNENGNPFNQHTAFYLMLKLCNHSEEKNAELIKEFRERGGITKIEGI